MTLDSNDGTKRNRNRSWWRQRTSLERSGIIFLAISILVIIALIIALVLVSLKNKENAIEDKICNTPDCVQTAARILQNIDESADPCNDFYEFVCGNFLRETTIPEHKTEVGPLVDLNDLVQQQLRTIFEEPVAPDDPTPFVMLKTLYNICMNTTAIEEDGLTTVKELLKDLGGWPILEGNAWDEKGFDWRKSVYKFRKNGLSTDNFIKIDIEPDLKNSSQALIELDQAELEIGRENLLAGFDDSIVKAYYSYMVDLAELFGVQRVQAQYEVKLMIEFKMQLANISMPDEERREKSTLYHPMTVHELQQAYPTVYWLEYLNSVIDLPDQPVTNDQIINVCAPNYLSKIAYLLSRTSKRAQANHAIFQALRSLVQYLPEAIRNREQLFKEEIFGASKSPRWEECVTITSKAFDLAASGLYVRKYFKDETKQSAIEMVSDIRDAFVKTLKKADWMDETTKKKALEKALDIQSNVGYSDELKDDKKLDEYYSELSVHTDNLLKFMANVTVFQKNILIRFLGQELNKTDWRTRYPPIEVNAVYNPQENSVQLPVVVLQSAFFNKDRLRSMNYGNMGFFIGHEITHGFDNEGRKFDKEGNLANWWADETNEAFLKKTECIIQQYSNYTVEEIDQNVDGVLTQGENIADNGGVNQAYSAYTEWVERNGPEPGLPGLKYSAKQLFWISAASCWCTKERKESLESSIIDVHSPPHFRIVGALSNSDYFATDFQCPVGSKMNPKDKCEIW